MSDPDYTQAIQDGLRRQRDPKFAIQWIDNHLSQGATRHRSRFSGDIDYWLDQRNAAKRLIADTTGNNCTGDTKGI